MVRDARLAHLGILLIAVGDHKGTPPSAYTAPPSSVGRLTPSVHEAASLLDHRSKTRSALSSSTWTPDPRR